MCRFESPCTKQWSGHAFKDRIVIFDEEETDKTQGCFQKQDHSGADCGVCYGNREPGVLQRNWEGTYRVGRGHWCVPGDNTGN